MLLKKVKLVKIDSDIKSRSVNNFERLGIKNIKRVPSNPFKKNTRKKIKSSLKNMNTRPILKLPIY